MVYPRLPPDQIRAYWRNEIRNYTTEKLIEYGRQCAERPPGSLTAALASAGR